MSAMQLSLHFEMMVEMKLLPLSLIPWAQKVLYCAMRFDKHTLISVNFIYIIWFV